VLALSPELDLPASDELELDLPASDELELDLPASDLSELDESELDAVLEPDELEPSDPADDDDFEPERLSVL
jgi:hypothetical protein